MEQRGFIQDMLDVKVLILFVMARVQYPVDLQKIYELCYQDDRLSYFDVSVAVPEMVRSGHLSQTEDGSFVITDKGRDHEAVTCDAIAYPVMQRAQAAVDAFNREMRRRGLVRTQIDRQPDGSCTVAMTLNDEKGMLMKLELSAPNITHARALARAYEQQADSIFQTIMTQLLASAEERRADV